MQQLARSTTHYIIALAFTAIAFLAFSKPASSATGCDIWDPGWRDPSGRTAEQVAGAPTGTTFTNEQRAAVKAVCIQTQDELGITAAEWTRTVMPYYSGCLTDNPGNGNIDYCNNETIRYIPSLPGIAANRARVFRSMCIGKLGGTAIAQCDALSSEVELCIASGSEYNTCYDRFGSPLDIFYAPGNCPAGQWFCGGRCATQSVMANYDRRYCDGESRWYRANGCGGTLSPALSAGCGSCPAGQWACGAICADTATQNSFNSQWVNGQAQWKYEIGRSSGNECGGAQSVRKCAATQVRCDCGAGTADDQCATTTADCTTVCPAVTSSAGTSGSPGTTTIPSWVVIPDGCAVTGVFISRCVDPGSPRETNSCVACLCGGNSWTGVGCLNTSSSNGIIITVMRIVLGVVGGIFLILMISAGYLYNTGKTENIEKAKQRIIAMFGALAFIAFSVIILRTIGVNILDVTTLGIIG